MTRRNMDPASLEVNARSYKYDPDLDAAADLIEQGPDAWRTLPPQVLRVAVIHKDLRDSYRAAVAAGAIPDDRNAQTYQPKMEW